MIFAHPARPEAYAICPVCLRKTIDGYARYPPQRGNCGLCDVPPDSPESEERAKAYDAAMDRALAAAGVTRK